MVKITATIGLGGGYFFMYFIISLIEIRISRVKIILNSLSIHITPFHRE